ncbi:MAG: hypothetical protein WA001_01015 [Patescibacteria group bacterium]
MGALSGSVFVTAFFVLARSTHEEPKCPPAEPIIVVPAPAAAATPTKTSNVPEYTSRPMHKKGDVVTITARAFGCSDNPGGSICTVEPGGSLTVTETVDRRSHAACQYTRSGSDNVGECKTGVVACELDWVQRTMSMQQEENADLKRIFNK